MKLVEVIDESTGKVVGQVPRYDGQEIAHMVDAAFAAQPDWELAPLFERAQILYKFCDLVSANIDVISNYMACEMGKPIMQARAEVDYAAEIGRNNIEYGKHMFGRVLNDSSDGHENDVVMVRHEALGVVAAVIPFNYPVELTIQKIVPALLMGNAVVVKASTAAPCSVKKLIDLAHEAGVPQDVLHFVTSSREDCTEHLLTNKKIACIAMTGSTAAGTEMMQAAAPTIKKVILELGGNDPLIIREDVAGDPEQLMTAIECLGWGRILENNGQVCASPKRTLVHKSVHDAFIKCLLTFVKSLKRGHATDPDAQLTRLVSSKAAQRVVEMVQHTVDQGATLLYGGTRNGAAMDVTILDNVTKDMDVASDMEIFGPVISVIPFETDEEAIEIANQSKYGLSSSVITLDMKKAFYYAERIESSAVWINGSSALRHNDQPFGGCKGTGIGNEGAGYSCEEFTRKKTVGFHNITPRKHLLERQDGTGAVLNDVRKMVEKVI